MKLIVSILTFAFVSPAFAKIPSNLVYTLKQNENGSINIENLRYQDAQGVQHRISVAFICSDERCIDYVYENHGYRAAGWDRAQLTQISSLTRGGVMMPTPGAFGLCRLLTGLPVPRTGSVSNSVFHGDYAILDKNANFVEMTKSTFTHGPNAWTTSTINCRRK